MRNLLALSIISLALISSANVEAFRGGAGRMGGGNFQAPHGGENAMTANSYARSSDTANHVAAEAEEHSGVVQHPTNWNYNHVANPGLDDNTVYVNTGNNGVGAVDVPVPVIVNQNNNGQNNPQ